MGSQVDRACVGVSIHAPVRGATLCRPSWTMAPVSFNPRARAGRDLVMESFAVERGVFQSTRPCGARPGVIHMTITIDLFQSTRPCGARPRCPGCPGRCYWGVSIHAPVRGATGALYPTELKEAVSIHAPVRGATRDRPEDGRTGAEFQSTRPCGARPPHDAGALIWFYVSIHAPVRGATQYRSKNPLSGQFQSTRPCGARPGRVDCVASTAKCFNPRARAGRDFL